MPAWARQPRRQVWVPRRGDNLSKDLVAAWECSDSIADHTDPVFPNVLNPQNRTQDLIRTSGGSPAAPGAAYPPSYGLHQTEYDFNEGPARSLRALYLTDSSLGPRGQAVAGELTLDLPDPDRYTIEIGMIQGNVLHAAVRNVVRVLHVGEVSTLVTVRDAGGYSVNYTPQTVVGGSGTIYSNAQSLASMFFTRNGASVTIWDFRAPARVLTVTTTVPTARLGLANLVSLWEGWVPYVRIYRRPIIAAEAIRLVNDPWSIWEPPSRPRRPAAAPGGASGSWSSSSAWAGAGGAAAAGAWSSSSAWAGAGGAAAPVAAGWWLSSSSGWAGAGGAAAAGAWSSSSAWAATASGSGSWSSSSSWLEGGLGLGAWSSSSAWAGAAATAAGVGAWSSSSAWAGAAATAAGVGAWSSSSAWGALVDGSGAWSSSSSWAGLAMSLFPDRFYIATDPTRRVLEAVDRGTLWRRVVDPR